MRSNANDQLSCLYITLTKKESITIRPRKENLKPASAKERDISHKNRPATKFRRCIMSALLFPTAILIFCRRGLFFLLMINPYIYNGAGSNTGPTRTDATERCSKPRTPIIRLMFLPNKQDSRDQEKILISQLSHLSVAAFLPVPWTRQICRNVHL